ncbi:hypothetical protein LCGC14_2714760 [marine sediment metagenome]|uniref:Uncharacterized protein n=1 Tax=marine sediment metagenome TaxID=412755 RepID=A0A0F8ZZH0_9ZZZZ
MEVGSEMEVGSKRTDEWAAELRRWIDEEGPIPALQVMRDWYQDEGKCGQWLVLNLTEMIVCFGGH